MLSSVARRLVEEARRLLKHHSSARANPGPAATFPTLCTVQRHWTAEGHNNASTVCCARKPQKVY